MPAGLESAWLIAPAIVLAALPVWLVLRLQPFLAEWKRAIDVLAASNIWQEANANKSGVVLVAPRDDGRRHPRQIAAQDGLAHYADIVFNGTGSGVDAVDAMQLVATLLDAAA